MILESFDHRQNRVCGNEYPYDSFCSCMIRDREEVPLVSLSLGRRGYIAVVCQLYLPSVPNSPYQLYPRLGRRARVQVICHYHHHHYHHRRRCRCCCSRGCCPRGDSSATGSHSPDGLRLITPVRDARMVRCHSLRMARAEFRTARLIIGSTIFENLITREEERWAVVHCIQDITIAIM